jgi:ubiquitin carboxyl-terminal hydrolase 20/33
LLYQRQVPGKEEERYAILEKIHKAGNKEESSYFVSNRWYCRWLTLSHPGKMTNSDFVCPHGKVNRVRCKDINGMVKRVPKNVYEYFTNTYGKDIEDDATVLEECLDCRKMEEDLSRRRISEREQIQKLDTMDIKNGDHWCLIDTKWLLDWHSFINGG